MKRIQFRVDVDIDLKFWHLVPSINLNLHSHELEFEWLCLGIYASRNARPVEQGLIDEIYKDVKYCMAHITGNEQEKTRR